MPLHLRKIKALVVLLTVALSMLGGGFSAQSVMANVPEMTGYVKTQTGSPVQYIHIKWQDVSGGVRFAKTGSDGRYRFPSWTNFEADPNYVPVPIPWNVTETGDESKRLIDIWKTNNFVQEFEWYPARTVNGVSLPVSSWSCRSNPNKFSVVVPDSYNCERVIVDRSHKNAGRCASIYQDAAPYQKSEVCQIDMLNNIENTGGLPDFICIPKSANIAGTVMCRTATGATYPIGGASVVIAGSGGGASFPVQNGAYSTNTLQNETMIAARLQLPASFQVVVAGQPITIDAAGTTIESTNGCVSSFMDANCSGINDQRRAQCDAHQNLTDSYEWCTLNVGSTTKRGFDFIVDNCVLPDDVDEDPDDPTDPAENACTLGKVSQVAAAIEFKLVGDQYQPITVTWKQAVENPVKTDFFDVQFFPETKPGSSIGPIRVAQAVAETSAGNFALTLADTAASTPVKDLHQMLKAAGKSQVIIEVTPVEEGSVACPAEIATAQLGTDTVPTTTDVLVKVREGNCTGDALPTVSGSLAAAWPNGGVGGPTTNYNLSVRIPTGSQLTSTYAFASDLYSCNLACTDDISTATQQKCQKTGYSDVTLETTIYLSELNISGWWETVGGLAYARAVLSSSLPLSIEKKPLVCPYVSETVPNPLCAPYLMRSPSFTQDTRAGLAFANTLTVARGWNTERPIVDTFATAHAGNQLSANVNGLKSFADYKALAEQKLVPFSPALATLRSLPPVAESVFYTTDSLIIDPADTITVPSGKRYTFYVNGTLTIRDNLPGTDQLIAVDQGGFLAFFVRDDIIIEPSVGTEMELTNLGPSTGVGQGLQPHITGLYITDGSISIQSNGAVDKRFIGDGSFISRGSINVPRQFNRGADPLSQILAGYTPTEVFRHRPDMVLAAPAELREQSSQYQEVR